MREYGLIKQTPGFPDLIAISYGINIEDIDTINLIEPEWTNDACYTSTSASSINTPTSKEGMKAGVYNNTEYDVILCGCSRISTLAGNVYCGLRTAPDSGNLSNFFSGNATGMYVVGLITGAKNKYLYVSQSIADPLPIIGIKLKS